MLTATAPNPNDSLVIEVAMKPDWLVFTDNGDGTATFSGTPSIGDVGSHIVTVQATDLAGASTTESLTILVQTNTTNIYLPMILR